MFGNEYNIVREFPLYFLDYREKFEVGTRWTDRVYSSSGERTGSGIPLIRVTWQQMKWPDFSATEDCNPERTKVRLQLPLIKQQEMAAKQQEMLAGQQETAVRQQETVNGNVVRQTMKMKILAILSDGEKSRREISIALGQKKMTGRLNQCIVDLLASGQIEKTLPDKQQSRFQKYRKRVVSG